jgi:hypothetical protein
LISGKQLVPCEPIVHSILYGALVRFRLDRKATSISLLSR